MTFWCFDDVFVCVNLIGCYADLFVLGFCFEFAWVVWFGCVLNLLVNCLFRLFIACGCIFNLWIVCLLVLV